MILHLIRHPKPLIEPGICYGQLDIPAENPKLIANAIKEKIPAGVPVWSSPLQRCRALAEALSPQAQYDARLMEMNFGSWEGRPWNDVPRVQLDAWAADVLHFVPPGGESASQVLERVLNFFERKDTEEMALVTHAGVIRLLLSFHNKQPLSQILEHQIPYGGVSSLYCFCHISF